ncbi:MAG: spore photoproduct lyase family protein [Pyrinomonadaceae bacterium]
MKTTTRAGQFIKQFVGPGDNQIICFKFWQAVIASGCPGECAYCFLQTQYPYRSGNYDLKGTLFSNLRDIEEEARRWLQQQKTPAGLILGENQDGLAFEGAYKKALGVTPLELLMPLFRDENPNGHLLIVLSKFTSTSYAEAIGPSKNVVFSWSLSLPTISRVYEKKVSSLDTRFEKAAQMKRAGYRIRFRLDALAPILDWEKEIAEVMQHINEISPEMLTIGALRASNKKALRRAAEANGRDGSIFDYIETVDPSGFKHRTGDEFHERVFQLVREQLKPGINLGLCKEDVTMWQATRLSWQGCHCLHGADDAIAAERVRLLDQPGQPIAIQRPLRLIPSAA